MLTMREEGDPAYSIGISAAGTSGFGVSGNRFSGSRFSTVGCSGVGVSVISRVSSSADGSLLFVEIF